MIPDWTLILGYTAGFCSTVAFLPQVIKSVKTRSTQDISLGMLIFFAAGVSLWTVYGIVEEKAPIVVANGITLVLVCVLFWLRITEKKPKKT